MRLYKLEDTVLSLKGPVAQFLNGLTSNTLEAPLNAFLNLHGRIIATVRLKKINDAEFLLSVPNVAVDNLLKHVERFAKLGHVSIEKSAYHSYIDLDTAQTVWDQTDYGNAISGEAFTLFRLEHQIPLMGVDYQADEFILNVDEHAYTSYTKGCFLGQEPVAKVHNRSKPTRKLVVTFQDELSKEDALHMTSRIEDSNTRRTRGFIFIANK